MHYLHSYEHDVRSPVTNSIVDSCEVEDMPTHAEWLKMAKHAQKLEIELKAAKNRINDYEWRDNPGQGMY